MSSSAAHFGHLTRRPASKSVARSRPPQGHTIVIAIDPPGEGGGLRLESEVEVPTAFDALDRPDARGRVDRYYGNRVDEKNRGKMSF
jgi:hypothetical protein